MIKELIPSLSGLVMQGEDGLDDGGHGVVADHVGDGPLEGGGQRPVERGRAEQVRPELHPFGSRDVVGTSTDTQATAPSRSSPAEPIDRSSSSRVAMMLSSHSTYGCGT